MRKILILALGLVALIVALPGRALAASPTSASLVVNNDGNSLGPDVVGEVTIGVNLAIENQEVQTSPVDTIALSSTNGTKGAESASTKTDVATKRVGFLKIGAGPLRL